jgi:DNA-binding CsgD family transcriptional regulator
MTDDAYADSRFGSQAVARLRAAFEVSRHPMLLADDGRRWVTGNAAACDLFGIGPQDVPWRRLEEFTPASEHAALEARWDGLLNTGAAEGWYQLTVPDHGPLPVEFSATANVLPARHLAVFVLPHGEAFTEEAGAALAREVAWTPVPAEGSGQAELTGREREVMTLVASGLQTGEIAERLFVAPETVKSHVQSAMIKLGAHTRARAVAVALVTGQISWEL